MVVQDQAGKAITWWQCEPRRLARDRHEVGQRFSMLQWSAEGAGRWTGRLPSWPFARAEPPGAAELVGEEGLLVSVQYGHAYPVVPPAIFPLDPEPCFIERTEHRWHVMGDGSLCLMQADAMWTGRDSIVDLLLKAAGWRLEYALMKTGAIETMTLHGIVDDPCLDQLFAVAAAGLSDAPASDEPGDAA